MDEEGVDEVFVAERAELEMAFFFELIRALLNLVVRFVLDNILEAIFIYRRALMTTECLSILLSQLGCLVSCSG